MTNAAPLDGTPAVALPATPTGPDFLCIGAQKAGTSWLYRMLRANPAVFVPPFKEIHFFDHIHIPKHRTWVRKRYAQHLKRLGKNEDLVEYVARLSDLRRRDDAWYRAVFDLPGATGKLKGDVTPAYSVLPSKGIDHVRAINPDMRMIFLIRDPVSRAMSYLRMIAGQRNWSQITMDTLDDVDLDNPLSRSSYRANILRWEQVFPAENFLYLPFGLLKTDPKALMSRVEAFLDIPTAEYPTADKKVNKTPDAEIDDAVMQFFEKTLDAERRWIAERFGDDFPI